MKLLLWCASNFSGRHEFFHLLSATNDEIETSKINNNINVILMRRNKMDFLEARRTALLFYSVIKEYYENDKFKQFARKQLNVPEHTIAKHCDNHLGNVDEQKFRILRSWMKKEKLGNCKDILKRLWKLDVRVPEEIVLNCDDNLELFGADKKLQAEEILPEEQISAKADENLDLLIYGDKSRKMVPGTHPPIQQIKRMSLQPNYYVSFRSHSGIESVQNNVDSHNFQLFKIFENSYSKKDRFCTHYKFAQPETGCTQNHDSNSGMACVQNIRCVWKGVECYLGSTLWAALQLLIVISTMLILNI